MCFLSLLIYRACIPELFQILYVLCFIFYYAGHGNLTPRTAEGKIVTMVYALIGVPLMLMCLSSLGGFLAEALQCAYMKLCGNSFHQRHRRQQQQHQKQPQQQQRLKDRNGHHNNHHHQHLHHDTDDNMDGNGYTNNRRRTKRRMIRKQHKNEVISLKYFSECNRFGFGADSFFIFKQYYI